MDPIYYLLHIINCAEIGADVMTGPLSAIKALANHPLTDLGLLFYGDHWKQETIDHAVELFHRTNAEDKEVLARMSKGLKSKSHQVGALSSSNFEGPLLDFYKYLDRKLSPVLGA